MFITFGVEVKSSLRRIEASDPALHCVISVRIHIDSVTLSDQMMRRCAGHSLSGRGTGPGFLVRLLTFNQQSKGKAEYNSPEAHVFDTSPANGMWSYVGQAITNP